MPGYPPALDTAEPCLAAFVDILAQSDAGYTVRPRGGGDVRALSALQWRVLAACGRFRSPAAHLAELARAPQPPPAEAARQALAQLRALGLLRARSDFLRAARAAPQPVETPPPITTCAWVTRERPEVLLRGVRSMVAENRRQGRDPAYHVYDDTPDPDACAVTRAALGVLAREAGVRMAYAGAAEKAGYLAHLTAEAARRGVDPAVVRFGLAPGGEGAVTTGANHNLMQLDTVGDLLLSLDDDLEAAPVRLRNGRPGVALSSEAIPNRVHPLATPEEAEAWVMPSEEGVLAAHERLLGRAVADLLRETPDAEVLTDGLGPALAHRLATQGASVGITMGGAHGDSGMGNARAILLLEGAARAAALDSEGGYRARCTRHLAVNMAPAATVSESVTLMAMTLGLDNRDVLVPHLPQHRGHDLVQGVLLRRGDPGRLVGHVPLGLRHAPPIVRSLAPESMVDPRPSMGGLFALMLEPARPSPGDARAGLAALGAHLAELAALPPAELRAWVRGRWALHTERLCAHLEALLRRHGGQPVYWATDVRRYVDNLTALAAHPAGPLPSDLALPPGAAPDPDAGWARVGALVGGMGRLLGAWPALTQAARDLRAQGVRAAQPVEG